MDILKKLRIFTMDEGELLGEIAPKLKRTKPSDRIANKRYYRQNKSKIKRQQKKYRKTAAGKKQQRKAEKMAKRGKTSTGKLITRRS